jgi:hypothetical protein
LRKKPNDPELQKRMNAAAEQEAAFVEAYRPMKMVADAQRLPLDGYTPLDETQAASFTGLSRRFREIRGKEMTERDRFEAEKIAKKAENANDEYRKANGKIFKTLDEEFGKIKTERKGPPTLERLRDLFTQPKEVC